MTDAYELGYAPGIREDYTYRTNSYPNVSLPVVILDNDFHDPDIERYVDAFDRYDPSVAILGDAYSRHDARTLTDLATELSTEHPYKTYVIVPKCREALDALPEDVVVGYTMGYAETLAPSFSDLSDWRGRRIHLLGGSPTIQLRVIEQLTQPTLSEDPPADIVGLDGNGLQKVAYFGEYWSPRGWQEADSLSIRETVRTSLREVKAFWSDHGVWPKTEPVDLYGPAVATPDDPVYVGNGADIRSRPELEAAIVVDYEEQVLAYRSPTEQAFCEWRDGRCSSETS